MNSSDVIYIMQLVTNDFATQAQLREEVRILRQQIDVLKIRLDQMARPDIREHMPTAKELGWVDETTNANSP